MDLINVCKYLMGGKEQVDRFLPALPTDRTRGNEHKLKHKTFCLNTRKYFFYCKGDQTLEQDAQRSCGVSICRDIQNPDPMRLD